MLLLAGPQLVIGLNGVTFAISAALLLPLRGRLRAAAPAAGDAPVPRSTRAGIGAVLRDPVVRTLMTGSGAVVLVAGAMNVAELVLAQQELGSGRAGFALLASAYGCGLIAGSLLGARDDGEAGIRRRYLAGIALMVAGLIGSALAPVIGLAMLTFAVTGAGNAPVRASATACCSSAWSPIGSTAARSASSTRSRPGASAAPWSAAACSPARPAGASPSPWRAPVMLLVLVAATRALTTTSLAPAFELNPSVR